MERWTQTSRRSWGSDHNSRASSGANRGNEKSRNSIVYNHLIEHPSDHMFLWQPTHSQGWRSRGGGGSFFHGSKKAASRQDVDSAARNSALGSSNGLHGRVGPKSAGAMLGSKSTAGPVLVSRHGRKGQAIPRDATPSRARTEPRLALAADGFSVSVTQLDGGFKNRLKPRSKTTPAMTSSSAGAGRHCDACAVDYVKHWLQNNVPTDSSRLLEEEDAASHISDMSSASISQQRASASAKKPEVSSPQGPHPFYEPLQLLRKEGGKEANQVYLLMQQGRRALPDPSLNREPASLHTVCLPRRGQVKLTGLAYELDNPEFYDTRKDNAGQMEQLRYDEQLIGPALPAPSCDPHRGWLIKDRNILKQVKYGEQLLHDEITEQENKLNDSNTLLNMLVGGLLHYEMPEVPNMNTNLKRFVGVKTGAAINNNDSNNQASRRQKSKSAHVIYSREGGNRAEIFQSPRHSERAYSQYLASPRVAFGDVSSDEKAQSADTPRTFHLQQNKKDQVDDIFTNISNKESPFSLHQVIAKAKKFHLNRTSDKSTQEKASVLPLIGHQ